MMPEKGSIRGVARATGHSKNTICKWVEIAGIHLKEVTTYFITLEKPMGIHSEKSILGLSKEDMRFLVDEWLKQKLKVRKFVECLR